MERIPLGGLNQLIASNQERQALADAGFVDYRDESEPLADRIRAAEAVGEWKLAGRLKHQLQTSRPKPGAGMDFRQAEGEPTLIEQIRAAEEAKDFKTAGRLMRDLERFRAQYAEQEAREERGETSEAIAARVDARLVALAESHNANDQFVHAMRERAKMSPLERMQADSEAKAASRRAKAAQERAVRDAAYRKEATERRARIDAQRRGDLA